MPKITSTSTQYVRAFESLPSKLPHLRALRVSKDALEMHDELPDVFNVKVRGWSLTGDEDYPSDTWSGIRLSGSIVWRHELDGSMYSC